MAKSSGGVRMSLYFDQEFYRKLEIEACRLNFSPYEFARFAVRSVVEKEEVSEIEKLQALNARMFQYLADRLSDLEILSLLAKRELKEEEFLSDVENKLSEVKIFNQKMTQKIIEESL